MTMISYAQNREDVLLARLFPPGLPGFFIDVGAMEPTRGSVTRHFYDQGWSGINIEPADRPFKRLQNERKRDININAGLSDKPGTLTFFEFGEESEGASTFSKQQADWHQQLGRPFRERKVPVMTLAQICAEHVKGTIDFLSIDVEGHEAEVIRGGDWTRWRPKVVLVEATEPTTTVPTDKRCEIPLLEADYRFACFDGLNRFYVRQEDAALLPALSTPANVLDAYIPYELHATQCQLAASRVLTQSLRAEYGRTTGELRELQASFQRLERAVARSRAQSDTLEAMMYDTRARCDDLREEYDTLKGEAERVQSLGPRTLEMAHRLRVAADRFPHTASGINATLRMARRLWHLRPPR